MDLKSCLKEARDAIKNKDYESALRWSKAVLKEDKTNYMAFVFMGISLQEVGQFEQAPNAFKKAIQSNKNNVLAWNGLANFYEKNPSAETNSELISIYKEIIALESNDAKLLEVFKKISTLEMTQCSDDILSLIENAHKVIIDGKASEKVIFEAHKAINSILNRFNPDIPDNFVNIYEETFTVLLSHPESVSTEIYTEYLKLLYKLKKYEELMREAENMYNFNSNNVTSLEWMCKIYGELYIEQNELHKSLKSSVETYYEVLLRLQNNSGVGLIIKAIFLHEDNNILEAKECLKKLTNLRPGLLHAWILYTKCNIDLHFYNEAIETGYKADKLLLSINNSNHTLRGILNEYLCVCLSKSSEQKHLEAGVELCLSVIKETHDSDGIIKCLVQTYVELKNYVEAYMWVEKLHNKNIMKAKIMRAQGKLTESLALLESKPETSSDYWNELGEIHWNLGHFAKTLVPFLSAAKLDQNSYKCFLNLGNFYQKAGDFDKARRCYEKCFKINRKCAEAGIELSKIYRKQQKWDENLALLQSLTVNTIASDNQWAHIQLGLHYLEQEDYVNAISSLRLVIRFDPNNSHCWESLADAYLARGAFTSALKSYQRASELVPNSLYPMLQLGNIDMLLGAYTDARVEFEKVLRCNAAYIPALKGISEACLNQARQYYKQQLHGLARDCLQYSMDKITQALREQGDISCLWKLAADSSYLASKLPERFCCIMVSKALADGSDDERRTILEIDELLTLAARCYCKAINLTEDNILIYHDLACCYVSHSAVKEDKNDKIHLLERATTVAQHCIANNDTFWQHYNLLGNIAFQKEPKNLALAQHAFIKAITLERNSAIAWSNLGVVYYYAGDFKLANEAFSQAQRGDPNYVNSWVGQALIAEAAGHEDAMDLFRHTTQIDSQQQGAIGYAYWVCRTLLESSPDQRIYSIHNMHAIPVACDALTWYVENNPDDSCAWNMLGLLRERMGLKQSAVQAFRKSLLLSEMKNRDIINSNYGRSLSAVGKYGDSVRLFKDVREATFNSGIGLALALFKDECYEKSYESYEAALNWLTDEAVLQSDLLVALASMAYLFQGPDAAKSLLFQSTQLTPRSSWGLYATLALGLIHGDLNLAQLVLKELELVKDKAECLPHYAILLSYTYLLQHENTKAVREISKLIHRHPNQASLWLTLSTIMLRLNSEKRVTTTVAKCAQIAMKLGQSNMDITKILCIISVSFVLAGHYKEGLREAQNAIHLYPHMAETWSILIYALKYTKASQEDIDVKTKFVNSVLKCSEPIGKWLVMV